MMKIHHILFTLVCCIAVGSCGKSNGPPSGVAEKIEIYPVLKSEFASIGDPLVERVSGKSFLVEASKGLWKTDINYRLVDGRDTLEKHDFSSGDEERAIKSLRKHVEKVLIDNGFDVSKASEEQTKVDIAYRKGSVTGSIAFAASSSGKMMTLSYSHEERQEE
jgi:hypothetical protein